MFLGANNGKVGSGGTQRNRYGPLNRSIIENIPGTNVVTTFLEHPSNYSACSFYAKKASKEVRIASTNPINGGVNSEEILSKIDDNTCLLSFIYSSNITGKNLEVRKIIEEARKIKPDLFIFLDATQSLAHIPIDIEELGIDGIAFNQYKVFGKRTMGLGWVSKRLSILPHEKYLKKPIDEWDLGGSEPAGFGAWSSVVDYICWLGSHFTDTKDRRSLIISGMENIMLQERALLEYALNGSEKIDGLRNINQVNIHFIPEDEDLSTRALLLPITIEGKNAKEVVQHYLKNGIVVYDRTATSLFSKRTLDALGIHSLIRVSPIHCNSPEEIDKFLSVTSKIS